MLERAAVAYLRAHMYEAAHSVYKILLPIVEYEKNYERLSKIYSVFAEYLSKIECKGVNSDKRLFGTFFR